MEDNSREGTNHSQGCKSRSLGYVNTRQDAANASNAASPSTPSSSLTGGHRFHRPDDHEPLGGEDTLLNVMRSCGRIRVDDDSPVDHLRPGSS